MFLKVFGFPGIVNYSSLIIAHVRTFVFEEQPLIALGTSLDLKNIFVLAFFVRFFTLIANLPLATIELS